MTNRFISKRHNRSLNLLCQHCDQRFTNGRFRLFCSHECKVEYYAELDRHLWTKDEEDYIIGLVGLYPTREIVRRTKNWLTVKVPDSRIKQKVEEIARQEGLKIGDRVDNHSVGTWAKLLGNINELRIHRWISKGLKSRRSGKEHMISHKNMIAFAKENVSLFQSIDRQYLEWLFTDDMQWVNIITNAKPAKSPVLKVLCVTSGITYDSLTKAEEGEKVSRARIKRAVETGIPISNGSVYLSFKWANT